MNKPPLIGDYWYERMDETQLPEAIVVELSQLVDVKKKYPNAIGHLFRLVLFFEQHRGSVDIENDVIKDMLENDFVFDEDVLEKELPLAIEEALEVYDEALHEVLGDLKDLYEPYVWVGKKTLVLAKKRNKDE